MSETTPTTPPPVKEDETKKLATTPNGSTTKKFEGDGSAFKGKLIGMEDLSIDRDEKICLDSMFKLKAVVKARGEHKQRIQLNLTMSAVKIIDDTTKAQIASHEIERISFVVIDPRDTRAFGYVYNTSDDRHQFWAIKSEKPAAMTVLALKELFELAFEQYSKLESEKTGENTTTQPPTVVIPPPEPTVPVQEQPAPAPVVSLPPPPPPPAPEPPIPEPVPKTETPSLLDDDWGPAPTTTTTQPSQQNSPPLFSFDEPIALVIQPTPSKTDDPFDGLIYTPVTPQQPTSAATDNTLLDIFANITPTPVQPPNPFGNVIPQQTQPSYLNTTPVVPQYQSSFPPQQQNLLGATPISPVAPPSVTSPFAGLDILGSSSATTNKAAKDLFFPSAAPPKTIQQMQMDKP